MTKNLLYALCMLLISAPVFAQQKFVYDANAEKRSVSGFHGVKVSTGIQLYIMQGNTEEVAVSAASSEDRSKIKTEVVNGILKIYYEKENNWSSWNAKKKELKAWVSFKNIDMLNGSSGSETKAEGIISATSLSLGLSSGAELTADISCSSIDADVSSGADMTLSGNTETIKVEASSGADFKGYNLKANICDADASSGADIEITANKEISAEASSGGGVHYKGSALVKSFSKSSGGSIKKEK